MQYLGDRSSFSISLSEKQDEYCSLSGVCNGMLRSGSFLFQATEVQFKPAQAPDKYLAPRSELTCSLLLLTQAQRVCTGPGLPQPQSSSIRDVGLEIREVCTVRSLWRVPNTGPTPLARVHAFPTRSSVSPPRGVRPGNSLNVMAHHRHSPRFAVTAGRPSNFMWEAREGLL